jgi:hypothetical protein
MLGSVCWAKQSAPPGKHTRVALPLGSQSERARECFLERFSDLKVGSERGGEE